MERIIESINFCEFHNGITIKKQKYTIYRIGIFTNLNMYTTGVQSLDEELNKYIFDNNIKLSVSQIILLRPDILLNFCKNKYNTKDEKVKEVFLYGSNICEDCYKEYIKEVPEK